MVAMSDSTNLIVANISETMVLIGSTDKCDSNSAGSMPHDCLPATKLPQFLIFFCMCCKVLKHNDVSVGELINRLMPRSALLRRMVLVASVLMK
ncbi:MAG: hypothetical protein IPN73_00275 [Saprospiraceae bacterium]|nr:hypothetical protein [Saprospiraceae bacterium]